MNPIWSKICDHVFKPYERYLAGQLRELVARHRHLTARDFTGWFHPSLVGEKNEIDILLKRLEWDMTLCRQATVLVLTRANGEEEALSKLPARIVPPELKEGHPTVTFMDAPTGWPEMELLPPEIIETFDHYLGLKVVFNT